MKKVKSFWEDRHVFVTGATGLLGSWLVEALVNKGARVVVLIRDQVSQSRLLRPSVLPHVSVVRGEVENYHLLERTLNEYEVDTAFHLAAQTIVGVANQNPLSTFESNIKGTWCLLEACRRTPLVKRIVVASSDKAYGDQEILPYLEDAPLQGRHPYDVSKSCADLICRSYYESFDVPVCVTRCGNLYGGGDLNFNRLIPGVIRAVLRGGRPEIRSNGTLIRDYFYVKDGAEAYMQLAEMMESKKLAGEAFNFSNENQKNVMDITNAILKIMGAQKIKPVILNQAFGEIKHQYLSAEKARKKMNWRPRYTLEKGLKETVKWYTDFLKAPKK